jgi:hypothetical protein
MSERVMDRDEEYWRNAAEAQRWADKAVSDDDWAAWLRIAQGWMSMVRKPAQTAQRTVALGNAGLSQDEH